ncbi:MAG: ABC transporter permease [Actinobacteria bacterium]|nr:ABC transporter permease [Actinomycetota bacterium]
MSLTLKKRNKIAKEKKGRDFGSVLRSQGLLLMLILMVIFFRIQDPEYFLTFDNAITILVGATALGIMASAQTPLIISGGIDVSVGSVVALTTVVVGKLLATGMASWLVVVISILIGTSIGLLNGFIVVQLGVNPFITTLGTMSFFSGLSFILSAGQTVSIRDHLFDWFLYTKVFKIPVLVIIVVFVMALAYFVERKTVVGRNIFAIGGNREAARLSGISTKMLPLGLYVVSSLSAALAGVVLVCQLGSASPQLGTSYLLSVVTAVILGGTSLAGGRGSIAGTAIAVGILATLSNGFAHLQLPSYGQTTALGAALIIAVLVDQTSLKMKNSK